ncbi:MAG: YigZ family protein [bacterium]
MADPREPGILTVAGRCEHEGDRVKGSRFLAIVDVAAGVDDALARLAEARGRFPDATHHCWAWRGDGRDAFRWGDDGEPAGSAGRPMLAAIDGRGLSHTAVIVVRWFGGTKLGVGGLVRAYGAAAAEVIARAGVVFEPFTTDLDVTFDYGLSGAVQSVLTAHGQSPVDADYGAEVRLTLRVVDAEVAGIKADIEERTAGRARCVLRPGRGRVSSDAAPR